MRMRRKSNLETRLQNCDDYLLFIETDEFYYKTEEEKFNNIDPKSVFGNENPLWLEIGCGKGQFAIETANANPDINIIAIEKISNVILSACETAKIKQPKNCKFLNCAAENLPYYFKDGVADRIFLNFSCPYPKKSYKNRRLTYHRFLDVYKKILAKNGEIHLKTDNMGFFEFSIESLSANGFIVKNISLDLHNSNFKGNIVTEYESMFVAQGKPIYRLEAYLR